MRYFALAGLVLVPGIALAAPRTLQELAYLIVDYTNAGIGVALILGIVVYFLGVTEGLRKTVMGQESSALRTHIIWGILALFVMFSVWGILALLRNTLFGGGSYDPFAGDGGYVECKSLEDCVLGNDPNRP